MGPFDIVVEIDNLLHANPSLYEAFYSGTETSMAYFLRALFEQYKPGPRILDVGCGLGREAAYLCCYGYRVDGLDNSEQMIQWASSHYAAPRFIHGDLCTYVSKIKYDALYCVGSSFMYNFTNESAIQCLRCFRQNLREGGLLYLDMRNAAIFLTDKGQQRLNEEGLDEAVYQGQKMMARICLSIDLEKQLLNRDYCWQIPGTDPIHERLQHRLFFPQELALFLSVCGFRVLRIFDKPDAHNSHYKEGDPLEFSSELTGSRLQVIAEAI